MVCVQARPTHNGSLHKVQRPTESSHEPKHEIPLVKLEQVGGAKRQGALLIGGSELGKILVGGEGEEVRLDQGAELYVCVCVCVCVC